MSQLYVSKLPTLRGHKQSKLQSHVKPKKVRVFPQHEPFAGIPKYRVSFLKRSCGKKCLLSLTFVGSRVAARPRLELKLPEDVLYSPYKSRASRSLVSNLEKVDGERNKYRRSDL